MNSLRNKLLFAITPAVLLSIHLIKDKLSVNTIDIALLVFAYIPWLASIIEAMELPGVKLTFKDVEKLREKVNKIKTKKSAPKEESPEVGYLKSLAVQDPVLALAAIRMNLEGLLRDMAVKTSPHSFIAGEQPTLAKYIAILEISNILPTEAADALFDALNILNKAVHGLVKEDVADAAVKELLPVFAQVQSLSESLENPSSSTVTR